MRTEPVRVTSGRDVLEYTLELGDDRVDTSTDREAARTVLLPTLRLLREAIDSQQELLLAEAGINLEGGRSAPGEAFDGIGQ